MSASGTDSRPGLARKDPDLGRAWFPFGSDASSPSKMQRAPAVRVPLLAAILSLSASGLDSTTIAASSALHVDQFRAVYEAPKDPAHQALYEELKAARSLESLREFLSF